MDVVVICTLCGIIAGLILANQRPVSIEIDVVAPETAAGSYGCAPFVAVVLVVLCILALLHS